MWYAVVNEQGHCTMLVQQWEASEHLREKGYKTFEINSLEELQLLMIEVSNRWATFARSEKNK